MIVKDVFFAIKKMGLFWKLPEELEAHIMGFVSPGLRTLEDYHTRYFRRMFAQCLLFLDPRSLSGLLEAKMAPRVPRSALYKMTASYNFGRSYTFRLGPAGGILPGPGLKGYPPEVHFVVRYAGEARGPARRVFKLRPHSRAALVGFNRRQRGAYLLFAVVLGFM